MRFSLPLGQVLSPLFVLMFVGFGCDVRETGESTEIVRPERQNQKFGLEAKAHVVKWTSPTEVTVRYTLTFVEERTPWLIWAPTGVRIHYWDEKGAETFDEVLLHYIYPDKTFTDEKSGSWSTDLSITVPRTIKFIAIEFGSELITRRVPVGDRP